MNIKNGQQTTKLGTPLTFKVLDMRGKSHFPQSQEGFVFFYHEIRTIYCRLTRVEIKRDARYTIRTDNTQQGWRVDLVHGGWPLETVYGPKRESYWPTAELAAAALVQFLDVIATTSTIG